MKRIRKLKKSEFFKKAVNRLLFMPLWLLQLPTSIAPYNRILLISYAKQMDEHVIDFCEAVGHVEGAKLFLFKKNYESSRLTEYAKTHHIRCIEGKSIFRALTRHYDLVVTPDYAIDKLPQIIQPTKLYINHGMHIVGQNGGKDTYVYSELYSQSHFHAMLEPNKHIAEAVAHSRPELSNVVKWVGWKFSEKEERECVRKDHYKAQLALPEGKPIVFIVSTWGECNLFYKLGDGLFSELQRLSDRYLFVLSAHPNIYYYRPKIGQMIDAQVQHGMRVRQPGEDWLPYIAACDIVLTDYSTLSEVAVCAGKKVIFTDFPEETVWNESRLYRAKTAYPSLASADRLEAVLETVQTAPIDPHWKSFRDETYIPRKEYEEKVRAIVRQLLNA